MLLNERTFNQMAIAKKYLRIPVLSAFFIMGFCDVVGISTSYVKESFGLSETIAGFIPSMVFIWFLFLSVPIALMMNKIGRKRTVQAGNVITFVAMLVPLVGYNFTSCMIAFVLLGIGNTLLQVALNPLLTNVVDEKSLSSSLTAGQVIKAVSSFCGPFIAAFAASQLGDWRYMFPIFALLSFLSWALLAGTPIPREEKVQSISLSKTFAILGDRMILLLFLGVFFLVGVDVGTNTIAPKLMMERAGWALEKAGLSSSVYFLCRTAGAFLGTFLLTKVDEIKYFRICIICAAATLVFLFFAGTAIPVLIGIGLLGFLCSSIFSILVSCALRARPERANEISGFMITGVVGGAVIPPLMGVCADSLGNQNGSLAVIGVCLAYLVFCSLWLRSEPIKNN